MMNWADLPTLKLEAPPQRIAILRALQLGDMLQSVPALRAIRTRFPHAEITLIGLPWAASFVCRFQRYIDRFIEFAGYPGITEVEVDPQRTAHFIEEQQAYGYDLVVQMHGSGKTSNALALALGGRVSIGYYDPAAPAHELTLAIPYPDNWPEVLRNLGLARLLGCTDLTTRLEFPLFNEDLVEAATLLHALPRADRPWIGLHGGARPPARRWPLERFARVGNELMQRFGAQIILTGGPGEEAMARTVEEQLSGPALNLAGQTSLGALAGVISKLDLFISNDTGPAHIANAVDTFSITIFGPADHRRWAPLDQARHPIVRQPVECSPCGFWECPIDHRCLRRISSEMVIEVATRYLQEVPLRGR
ncbi:MAG: glycosyltransferase family 9 protein [Ktedonobacteraceae bacterium]|nr:glycosyltransferase family 9 protein [Ktedonobacteraceae bacterium]